MSLYPKFTSKRPSNNAHLFLHFLMFTSRIQKGDTDMWVNRVVRQTDDINGLHLVIDEMNCVNIGAPWRIERTPPMRSRLIYFMDGDLTVEYQNKTLRLEPGRCYLIPTGCAFKLYSNKSSRDIVVNVRLLDSGGMDILRCCNGVMECEFTAEAFDQLAECVTDESITAGLKIRRYVYESLIAIFERNNFDIQSPTYSPEVLKALEYIHSRLTVQLDVDEVATEALVSVSTLTKKFKSEIGSTVSAYIDCSIMREASKLLLNSSMTIQQISEHFGFCYQSYFTRRFKLWFGVTPQQYRGGQRKQYPDPN